MRIALAGFMHESNTFSEVPTTLQQFQDASLKYGADLIPVWEDAHHEMGGFIQGAKDNGFEAVPILMSRATPSGPVTEETYEKIVGDLIDGLKQTDPLDGLLLARHPRRERRRPGVLHLSQPPQTAVSARSG